MIRINNVSFRYANADEFAIRDINITVHKGEFLVLLGESGCGKTTITRLINRLVPEFYEGDLSGKVLINGKETTNLSIQNLAGIVGSVFQDPRSQFFATDTTAEIAFSCENVGLPREELCKRIEKAANDLQIKKLLERSIFELSSGEKQAIAIASVYALTPQIFVLDEPSANLDTAATKHLMEILNILKNNGYTVVVSEHRIHYLKDIADRAILMKNGKIVKEITKEGFRTLTNKETKNMGLRSVDLTKIKPNTHRKKNGIEQLKLQDISFNYGQDNKVLNNVSFSADKGNVIGIIGSNGAGKSTLLEIICGLQKERSGRILFNDNLAKPKNRIKNTFLVMQNSDYQLFTESVAKEICLESDKKKSLDGRGLTLLKRMDLDKVLERHPASLSGGQKQRLCIAVACMKDADIVCFDEPTSGLDYIRMKNVSDLLYELSEAGKTLLVTTHDYEFLMLTCTHICFLKEGSVAEFFEVNEKSTSKIYNILFQEETVK